MNNILSTDSITAYSVCTMTSHISIPHLLCPNFRQKSLRENYLFACICVKCEEQAQDPDETSEEEMSEEDEGNDEDDEEQGG